MEEVYWLPLLPWLALVRAEQQLRNIQTRASNVPIDKHGARERLPAPPSSSTSKEGNTYAGMITVRERRYPKAPPLSPFSDIVKRHV